MLSYAPGASEPSAGGGRASSTGYDSTQSTESRSNNRHSAGLGTRFVGGKGPQISRTPSIDEASEALTRSERVESSDISADLQLADLLHRCSVLRFVALEDFEAVGTIPRFGSSKAFVHPVTKQRNKNICMPFSHFHRDSTVFIFVSHRWLRPSSSADCHPDDAANQKHTLICEACKRLRGSGETFAIPEHFRLAVWIDFSCVDQDGNPAQELDQHMAALIEVCDMVLTPIVDYKHASWSMPLVWHNAIEVYQAEQWKEYWQRAWCRVESLLAAVLPLQCGLDRADNFHGGLRTGLRYGRRAHVVFGTKELETTTAGGGKKPPIFLPPLIDATLRQYPPAEGALTCEDDRAVISRLTTMLLAGRVSTPPGYKGEFNDEGERHGEGTEVFESGEVYMGQWRNDKMHGRGIYTWVNGDKYSGGWESGKPHGHAMHTYADGGLFCGAMALGMREGRGTFIYPNGDELQGYYSGDLKVKGLWAFPTGEMRVVRWELHASGKYSVMCGDGAFWSADRHKAWKLTDGEGSHEAENEISLEESAEILRAIGDLGDAVPPAKQLGSGPPEAGAAGGEGGKALKLLEDDGVEFNPKFIDPYWSFRSAEGSTAGELGLTA